MATFYVGQRVRIVNSVHPKYIGVEATVTSISFSSPYRPKDTMCIRHDNDGMEWSCAPENIEPIQPERNRVIAWSKCLWQPKVHADA